MMLLSQTPNFALAEKLGLDIPAMTAHVRTNLAGLIRHADTDTLDGIIRRAVVDFGGTMMEPVANPADRSRISNWGPGDYQLSLLDCSGTGTTVAEAATDWAKAARRMVQKPDRDAA